MGSATKTIVFGLLRSPFWVICLVCLGGRRLARPTQTRRMTFDKPNGHRPRLLSPWATILGRGYSPACTLRGVIQRPLYGSQRCRFGRPLLASLHERSERLCPSWLIKLLPLLPAAIPNARKWLGAVLGTLSTNSEIKCCHKSSRC